MNRSIGVGNGEDKLGGSMEIDTIDRHLSGIGHRGTSARKDWKEGKKDKDQSKSAHDKIKIMLFALMRQGVKKCDAIKKNQKKARPRRSS